MLPPAEPLRQRPSCPNSWPAGPCNWLIVIVTLMTKLIDVGLAIFWMSASKAAADGALFRQHGAHNLPQHPPDMMRLGQLQRPLQAVAVAGSCRPTLATFTLPSRPAVQSTPAQAHPADGVVEGRRYASVKSQGAYRIPNKKTIAKKLGAKKSGGMFTSAVTTVYRERLPSHGARPESVAARFLEQLS